MNELIASLEEIKKAKLSPQHTLMANLLASVEEWERVTGKRMSWKDIVETKGACL